MYHQSISGVPTRCLNRQCRAPFYKESHLGWLPKADLEVFAIMRCKVCKDTFAVAQVISIVHDYYAKLPVDPKNITAINATKAPITKKEVARVRQRLASETNILATLSEGAWQGAPGYVDREEL